MMISIQFDPNDQRDLMRIRYLIASLMGNEGDATTSQTDTPDTDHTPPPNVTFFPPTTFPGSQHLDPPASAASDVELDNAGLPWDERIHASSKEITGKGVWKKRRGVDKKLVGEVEGELRSRMSGKAGSPPAPHAPGVAPAAPTVPVNVPPPGSQYTGPVGVPPGAPPSPPATPPAPAPVAPPSPPAPPAAAGGELNWHVLLTKLTAAQQKGTYNEQRMDQLLKHWNIEGGAAMLATRPDLFKFLVDDEYLGLRDV